MRYFFETYSFFEISPSSTAQFETLIRPLPTIQFKLSVKTVHQITNTPNYPLGLAVSETIQMLDNPECHIESGLFQKQGKLTNNFSETLPEKSILMHCKLLKMNIFSIF